MTPMARSRGLFPNPAAALLLAAIAAIAPFCGKAFHIDDPLFVWAAKHIAAHPLDFYGFDVDWYSHWEPMSQVTQNPPLGCYYLALVGSVFGWSEIALHLAMILPAWLSLLGVYRLAELFGVRPYAATFMTLATPVFLVSATSVMCDVPMLALWTWTIILWDEGLRDGTPSRLWCAGVLIAVTTLTKYFGICLLPLLGVYAIAIDRSGWRRWLGPLILAVVLLGAYELITWKMYGHPLLGGAMGYAAGSGMPTWQSKLFRVAAGSAFFGGCIGVMALVGSLLIDRRASIALPLSAGIVLAMSLWMTSHQKLYGLVQTVSPFANDDLAYFGPKADLISQFVLWAMFGVGLTVLCVQDFLRERDARALLLILWIGGTWMFASFVNWTLNGRSVLPLVPAVSIVVVRRLQIVWGEQWSCWRFGALLTPALALAFALAMADRSAADSQRAAAQQLADRFPNEKPPFLGHWGFQFYMMEHGFQPWDDRRNRPAAGELLIVPVNNANVTLIEWDFVETGAIEVPILPWLTDMHYARGAGYYSEVWGPLPFTFGPVPPEKFMVPRLTKAKPKDG